MTGGPGKEHGTNKPPPAGRIGKRWKGDATCPTMAQDPPRWPPPWLSNVLPPVRMESEWLSGTTRKGTPSPWNPRRRATWQSSPPGFPYPTAPTRVPLPSKVSCFASTCVSSDNSFPSVRQEPSPGPWKGCPSLQQNGWSLTSSQFFEEAELCQVIQSCLTLSDPMDCSLPGSSVCGILQAIILEWVAISSSRGFAQCRDQTRVSHIAGRFFTIRAAREAPGKRQSFRK